MTTLEQPLKVYPLFCPQIPFKDRFGNYTPFVEMNPAMVWDSVNQEYVVIVRGVNYRKLANKSFTLYQTPAHSIYWIARGKELSSLEFKELKVDYGGLPLYSSYWNGVEDARFINSKTLLVTVPWLDKRGQPTMFTCSLENDVLCKFQRCEPSDRAEKNWMPCSDQTSVIYSCSPFVKKDLVSDQQEIISLAPMLQGYHGSTNGICWNNSSKELYLVHKSVEDKVIHRWVVINHDTKQVKVSDPFTFFNHTHIEFPCSLQKVGHSLFVSLGVNDEKAFIIQVKPPFDLLLLL